MKNEFDHIIQEQYESGSFEYEPLQWQRMAALLDKNEKSGSRKLLWLWIAVGSIAASVALATTMFIRYHSNETGEQHFVQSTSHKESVRPFIQKKETKQAEAIAVATKKARGTDKPILKKSEKENRSDLTTVDQKNTDEEKQPAVANAENKRNDAEKLSVRQNNNFAREKRTVADDIPFQDIPMPRNNLSLSIAGGVNYGSLNAGYMAGINAQKNIGRHFFLEGSIAMVNNSSTSQNTTNYTSKGMVNSFSTGWGTSTLGNPPTYSVTNAQITTTVVSNLYYLQFHPSIGYMPVKKLSLSIGADVQKMLEGDDVTIYVDNVAKLAPGTDIGATGKAEYALMPRLKAGVLYREGMNNLLNGTDKYFDRRYIQVQLKFVILK